MYRPINGIRAARRFIASVRDFVLVTARRNGRTTHSSTSQVKIISQLIQIQKQNYVRMKTKADRCMNRHGVLRFSRHAAFREHLKVVTIAPKTLRIPSSVLELPNE
jgi:hypothetical protein